MSFAATITITVNAVAKVLNRVNQDDFGSFYSLRSATEEITLQIRNSTEAAKGLSPAILRHNIFVERTIYATPTTAEEYYSFTGTIREYTTSDPVKTGYLSAGVVDWLDTAGVLTDLIAGVN
jgi:hypothetical protein